MLTTMTTAELGPVSLAAPASAPRHVVAAHGHFWQWIGDGEQLVSLSVAVRTTRLGTLPGVRHHLAWEVDQVVSALDDPAEASESEVLVQVDGAVASAAADVTGVMRGLLVRNRLVVCTDGDHMHVVRVLVPQVDAGREVVELATSTLRVNPWSMPA